MTMTSTPNTSQGRKRCARIDAVLPAQALLRELQARAQALPIKDNRCPRSEKPSRGISERCS